MVDKLSGELDANVGDRLIGDVGCFAMNVVSDEMMMCFVMI